MLPRESDNPMSEKTLYRDIVGTELRADESGRTIFGVVVPFNERAEINDISGSYIEMFTRGSFTRSLSERSHKIKLLAQHDHKRFPVGKATALVEQDDGLHGQFAIPATREGDDVLTLVRDGVLDSFSIGFRPVRDRRENGVTVRAEAALLEVSLVALPAYQGAQIAGIRAAQPFPRIPRELAERRLRFLEL
jgi:Escherichia/Staphylococcus phage prohead protease